MTIREATENDLAQLLMLYTHLHDETPLSVDEDTQHLWQSILNNPSLHYFVAEWDGQIVSTCNLTVIPNLTRGARPYGLIENVVTHRDYRGKGIGTAILKHALAFAWEQGCYKVMLLTGRGEQTERFYEKAGFVRGLKTGFIAKPPGV